MGALKKIYAGPKNSKGEQLFPGYVAGRRDGAGRMGGLDHGIRRGRAPSSGSRTGFFGDMIFQDAAWDFAR